MKKAACVLLLREDGKLLGASRRGSTVDFNMVGGKADPGESVKEAAIREFWEETGVKLSSENLLEVFTELCHGDVTYDTTTFLVRQNQDLAALEIPEIPACPEEGIIIRWITWDDLCGPNSSFREYNQVLYRAVSQLL